MKHKHLLMLLIAGITYTNIFAQPTIGLQKTIGGSSTDLLTSIYLTRDKGLIAGGSSSSNASGEKTGNNRCGCSDKYNYDYWVVKLDSRGKIQWDKTIGGNSNEYFSSLQQTSDGGYILGGYSQSNISGEKTENSRGVLDYWIVKLDATGNIQWDKTIGGNSNDQLLSLQQTNDGGYILGGYSSSSKSGEKTENSRGGWDYWVVKLDSLGNIQWNKTIGGSDYDELSSLQQTRDGGYILGGYSASNISGEKTENSRGNFDYWVVKLNSLGNIQWDKTVGGSDLDYLESLQQTGDAGYILGGWTRSNKSGEKTENSRGGDDYWVVKLDNFGNVQWDKTIGGKSYDELFAVQQSTNGGYILGGWSYSNISGEKTENSKGVSDYWVVKLDNSGKIEWDKTIGGNLADALKSIKEIGRNHYVLGGYSASQISGDKTEQSRGDYDYWLVELKYIPSNNIAVTTILNSNNLMATTETNSNKQFAIYPNPAKNILHIQTNGEVTVSLTDQSGKILLTQNINGKGETNVANLPAGLYYLKNNATGAMQKVIITK